jgi:hypothetical protein
MESGENHMQKRPIKEIGRPAALSVDSLSSSVLERESIKKQIAARNKVTSRDVQTVRQPTIVVLLQPPFYASSSLSR